MVYFNAILFCWIFSHFILKTESDLLKGILLGSALRDNDSEEDEILVIRIPRQRNAKKPKKTYKTTTTTTTTTSTESPSYKKSSTTEGYKSLMNYGSLDTMEIPKVTKGMALNSDISSKKKNERNLSPKYSEPTTTVETENICGANQTYSHCLNECGNRCNDMMSNKLCPSHCFGFGCTCAPNFVRELRTDHCVKPTDCPKPVQCPNGERYYICGGCGPTCEQPVPVCSRICRSEGGCDCVRGLVRNIHGKCVPLSLCPLSDSTVDLKSKASRHQNSYSNPFSNPYSNPYSNFYPNFNSNLNSTLKNRTNFDQRRESLRQIFKEMNQEHVF